MAWPRSGWTGTSPGSGRTLRRWPTEFLAYHDTAAASAGARRSSRHRRTPPSRRGHRNFDNYRPQLLLHLGVDWHDAHSTNADLKPPSTVGGEELEDCTR